TLFVTVHSKDGEQQKKLARGAESEDSNKIRKSHGSTPCQSPVHTILQRSQHAVWNMMCSTSFIWLLN
uniref:Uncharacterized protein n=1 Tax=Amphimedon queenslandica TaxID=400682 RepID=A0A1X7SIE2_AMPQE